MGTETGKPRRRIVKRRDSGRTEASSVRKPGSLVQRTFRCEINTGIILYTLWIKAETRKEAFKKLRQLWEWVDEGGLPSGFLLPKLPSSDLESHALKVDVATFKREHVTITEQEKHADSHEPRTTHHAPTKREKR